MSAALIEQKLLICGREYRLRCRVHEQSYLQEAARLLNEQVGTVRKGNGHLSQEQSIVLASLQIAQMLMQQQQPQLQNCQHQLDTLILLLEQR
ncbi:cell division protein ZapA [Rheinheimera sp.]|uniref:cell division protein ZapA n=1 Tax=Rheinheimera sp. TaxID=1869214 RepID=UPI00307F7C75